MISSTRAGDASAGGCSAAAALDVAEDAYGLGLVLGAFDGHAEGDDRVDVVAPIRFVDPPAAAGVAGDGAEGVFVEAGVVGVNEAVFDDRAAEAVAGGDRPRVGLWELGKPNPLILRSALNTIDPHSETTAMIGDGMDTDIVTGLEAGLETILVLTGVTPRSQAESFPYRASRVVESVADLVDELDGHEPRGEDRR
jgi:HAD-hyrolase-like protein